MVAGVRTLTLWKLNVSATLKDLKGFANTPFETIYRFETERPGFWHWPLKVWCYELAYTSYYTFDNGFLLHQFKTEESVSGMI
jgi:hypothetical protein